MVDRRYLFVLPLVFHSCATGDDEEPEPCFIGDPSQPPQLRIVYKEYEGLAVPAVDGQTIPITEAEQGGQVALINGDAKNIGCRLDLTVFFSDPCSDAVVGLVQRSMVLEQEEDGWGRGGRPQFASGYANLPVCPKVGFDDQISDVSYDLTVRFKDAENDIQIEETLSIIPTCVEDGATGMRCMCECASEFTLGGGACTSTVATSTSADRCD